MNKRTEDIEQDIKNMTRDRFDRENCGELFDVNFSDELWALLDEKNMEPKDVYDNLGKFATKAVHNLFSTPKSRPQSINDEREIGKAHVSRDMVIVLCFGMKLDFDEANKFLKRVGLAPLYAKNNRDCIIMMCLNSGKSVPETNDELYNEGYAMITK